jgi:hypothetical protein
MNDPIKIIWKFKNNNRRTQYNTYIFIGSVPKEISTILNKIKNLNFYDTMISLQKPEYKKLETYYNQKWYLFFFNTYHINQTIYVIRESVLQQKELTEKYGRDWYNTHIGSYTLINKKILYSYESIIKDERLKKIVKKNRASALINDDEDIDYSYNKKIILKKHFNTEPNKLHIRTSSKSSFTKSSEQITEQSTEQSTDQSTEQSTDQSTEQSTDQSTDSTLDISDLHIDHGGGAVPEQEDIADEPDVDDIDDETLDNENNDIEHDVDEDEDDDEEKDRESKTKTSKEEDEEEGLESTQILSEEVEDLEEIEEIYKIDDVNPDKNISETTSMIQKALQDENLSDKDTMIEFDTVTDNNMYDDKLKDNFRKYYVTTQYINKDDTIKDINNKICCSMQNNKKFDSESYILPSRQYLWGEYFFGDKLEKIMIGQKWLKKNELLNIDIEPNNNLRVYEELRGNLKLLKENIRRYNNKIKFENDENNILYDYDEFITNNEIYMIDVYNELGLKYSAEPDTIKNLQEVYLKIYFSKIKSDDVKYLIGYLNNDKKAEINRMKTIYNTLSNDLLLENEILTIINDIKITDKYQYIFKENYITQSVIHVNIHTKSKSKIDLFRIFNEFNVSEDYPFIQYQTPDGIISYKFNEQEISQYLKSDENFDILSKWFENAPYGISIKIKIVEKSLVKFMAINLTDNGQIQYKTQWKEANMATIEDIRNTYQYIKFLIEKINKEHNKVTFDIPEDHEFKYAFINSIQKFELPNKFIINHNDLSDFSRYFFPIVALVIDPRKRQAKIHKSIDKSKSGTYLRYKRVSKYENQARIEQRIMYFIRNFDYVEQSLINEISKQFNITAEKAKEEYERVKLKYPNLKKSRRVFKKIENVSKYKPPGIAIDIQGKSEDNYKIRISGARDKSQLTRMITFLNILIYLYIETYLYKIPERQILKEKLKKLTHIAKRRSKVDDIVKYVKDIKNIKQMTQIDKARIGFKPEKGQNQWTRSCQNSGKDKKRRPQQYSTDNIDEILKKGYIFNKKVGQYEKKIIQKDKHGKKKEITLKTIKMLNDEEDGNITSNEILYACDPEENGEHFYVGFLTRSTNPSGKCMPCCFKKDPNDTKNKDKQKFIANCINPEIKEKGDVKAKISGDVLYILQDTNKIQDGRFGDLPKYLDVFFNLMLNKQKTIKQHYLTKSLTGYFFKFGSNQDSYQFLNAFASIYDLPIERIKEILIASIEKDKTDMLFTSLNNGDIKTQFATKEKYITYIKESEYLNFEIINNLLSLPNVISSNGINIIVFLKKNIIIKKTFEKEQVREDFIILNQDPENVDDLLDLSKDNIFMIKENNNYYPIIMVIKEDETTKVINMVKIFKYEDKTDNIIQHINDFYVKNCCLKSDDFSMTSKMMNKSIKKIKDDFSIKHQYVDIRNKCKYLITNNNLIIPVKPSGSLYNIPIVKKLDKFINSYDDTYKKLKTLYKLSNNMIPVNPIGIYYNNKKGKKITINSIMTELNNVIIVHPEDIDIKTLEEKGILYEDKPLYDFIDDELMKGKTNFIPDQRITQIQKDNYENEAYELFRLEFSDYINKIDNATLKGKMEKIMLDDKMSKKEKVDNLKMLLFKLIDKELFETFKKYLHDNDKSFDTQIADIEINYDAEKEEKEQKGGKGSTHDKFIYINPKEPQLDTYQVLNDRALCKDLNEKEQCNINIHCKWLHSGCLPSMSQELIIKCVNKISEELALNDMKAFEITRTSNYFVSDIVDYNKFTEKQGQQIIKSTSHNIKKTLNELFGKEYIPKIGRKKLDLSVEIDYQQLNLLNPLTDIKDLYIQRIIENNLSIFRAFTNSYYWIKNTYEDTESKNLGYYSTMQTELANYFRSNIVDWLLDSKNKKTIKDEIEQYLPIKKKMHTTIEDFIIHVTQDIATLTNCIVELNILNKIYNIPIIVYNDNNDIIYIFDGILRYNINNKTSSIKDHKKYQTNKSTFINLRFLFISNKKIPDSIEVLYYKI